MFELGKVYRRRQLHEELGGQRQGGIITPKGTPVILLVTGDEGLGYGYNDEHRDDGTFVYYGEGQVGDMQFVRGNRAVGDHATDGRDLHLFRKEPPAHLRYLGQFVCAGLEYVRDVPDRTGALRLAIAFQLAPIDADAADDAAAETEVASLSLEELRSAALEHPAVNDSPGEAKRKVYRRSAAVRRYVLSRACGICEGCGSVAPFLTPAGDPYLEPHRTLRISDGGPDHPDAVIALCPTCHRQIHYGAEGAAYNADLMARLVALEPTG